MAQIAVSRDEMIIGENIRKIRKEHNDALKFLAEQIHYSENHLCAVEKGRKPASMTMLIRLTEYYNQTMDYFLRGTSLKYQLKLRSYRISKLTEELSDSSIDLVEAVVQRLWSMEHEDDNLTDRLKAISKEMVQTSEEE